MQLARIFDVFRARSLRSQFVILEIPTRRQLEDEIRRKAAAIAPHGLVERASRHAIGCRKVLIEQHPVAANYANLSGHRDCSSRVGFWAHARECASTPRRSVLPKLARSRRFNSESRSHRTPRA